MDDAESNNIFIIRISVCRRRRHAPFLRGFIYYHNIKINTERSPSCCSRCLFRGKWAHLHDFLTALTNGTRDKNTPRIRARAHPIMVRPRKGMEPNRGLTIIDSEGGLGLLFNKCQLMSAFVCKQCKWLQEMFNNKPKPSPLMRDRCLLHPSAPASNLEQKTPCKRPPL